MKPSPFDYVKPSSMDEALAALADAGDEATILAGGQSLVATLNMRLSAPAMVVDLNGLEDLAGIELSDGKIRIGALTRHRDLERSDVIAEHAPLIAEAVPLIAHPAIRNRGTIGGSIAFADPAAELPACLLALGGSVEITGVAGVRSVSAEDFFKGLYETDLNDGEIISALEVPAAARDMRFAFVEIARRHGDYGMAGVAAALRMEDSNVADARLVYLAAGGTPMLASSAGQALVGKSIGDESIAAAQAALENDLEPFDDMNSSAEMKLHLARVITERALNQIVAGQN